MAAKKLEWGLQPPAWAGVAWGARALFKQRGRPGIELLWDRQDAFGPETAKKELFRWMDQVGMPLLLEAVEDVPTSSRETVVVGRDDYTIKASPSGSHGYLYIVVFSGADDPRQWSPRKRGP